MTREEAINEINKVFEPAFANYIVEALSKGKTSATNGDIIKTLFPKDYINIYDRSVSSWWNAPYKGET